MAVTTESGLLSMLKVFYAKEGLVNLLLRKEDKTDSALKLTRCMLHGTSISLGIELIS